MKTLTQPQVTINGDTVTITAKIVDMPWNRMLLTKTTHGYVNPDNMKHPRRVVASSSAVFLEAPAGKVAMPNDFFAAISAAIEPKTTFAPVLQKGSTPNKVTVLTELPHTVQWQEADSAVGPWTNIAGATTDALDESTVANGKWVRCQITNAAGVTNSKPAQKQAAK